MARAPSRGAYRRRNGSPAPLVFGSRSAPPGRALSACAARRVVRRLPDVGREVGRGGWKACGGRWVLRRPSRAAPRPPTRACERAQTDRFTDAQLPTEVALSARVTGGRRQQRDARADDRQERQERTIRVVSCRRAALVGALSRAGAAGAGLVGGESRTVSPPGLLRRVATGARRGPVARGLVGSVVSALSVSRLLRFRLGASAQLGVWLHFRC